MFFGLGAAAALKVGAVVAAGAAVLAAYHAVTSHFDDVRRDREELVAKEIALQAHAQTVERLEAESALRQEVAAERAQMLNETANRLDEVRRHATELARAQPTAESLRARASNEPGRDDLRRRAAARTLELARELREVTNVSTIDGYRLGAGFGGMRRHPQPVSGDSGTSETATSADGRLPTVPGTGANNH